MAETPAHEQRTTIHLLLHVPAHEPREDDPHYAAFNEMKARMKKLGLLVCQIPGCTLPGPIEVHHSEVEFAFQGGVDLALFNKAYGLHLSADEFAAWVEGPGNAEPLCPVHHRGKLGIHDLPEPDWKLLRVWRPDCAPPAEVQ